MKKAQDLQSKDDKTRQQAEKDLDEKIGEENRKKLQEKLKDQKPTPEEAEKLKKQLEEMAKKPGDDFKPMGLGSSPPPKGAMEEDKKNRLKSAELMLEEFEKNRDNKALQAKQGWTKEEYEKFLKDYSDYVEKLRTEVAADAKKPPGAPIDLGSATLTPGTGGKVEALPGAKSGDAGVGGPTAAPPGFEDARRKFLDALNKKKP